MTANQRLHDFAVSHQIGLHRYSTATTRKVVALLNRVDGDIQRQISDLSPADVTRTNAKRDRLEKLLAGIKVASHEAHGAANRALKSDLESLSEYEAEFLARKIAEATGGSLSDLPLPKAEDLHAAVNSRPFQGKLLRTWFAEAEAGTVSRVSAALTMGFIEGQSTQSMIQRIRGTAAEQYSDGVLQISRRGAAALVRTAVSHVNSSSQTEFMTRNSDHIEGWQFSATLDSSTTPVCRDLDGEIFAIGKGPLPPRHIGCRSIPVPVLKGEKPPERKTYGTWLGEQSASVQDDILGKKKGRLFRKGGLSVHSFVDRSGREYTLDDLRKREAEAFERAGIE